MDAATLFSRCCCIFGPFPLEAGGLLAGWALSLRRPSQGSGLAVPAPRVWPCLCCFVGAAAVLPCCLLYWARPRRWPLLGYCVGIAWGLYVGLLCGASLGPAEPGAGADGEPGCLGARGCWAPLRRVARRGRAAWLPRLEGQDCCRAVGGGAALGGRCSGLCCAAALVAAGWLCAAMALSCCPGADGHVWA